MFVIEYNSTKGFIDAKTVVKVMIAGPDLSDESINNGIVHYDVYLEGLQEPDIDVTVNWFYSDLDNRGVFYTDSNSLEMIKREVDSYLRL